MTPGGNSRPAIYLPELLAPLQALAVPGAVRVALSGGLDSVVLLHLACHVFGHRPDGISAIHINHQLQPDAHNFERLCRLACESLKVPLEVVTVQIDSRQGSIETAAREARYEVFAQRLKAGETLLMAHHADDQIETLLFRFLRGTGVRGLAGMPSERVLGDGNLFRPWLRVPREQLRLQAQLAGWAWVEDPTNTDEQFDRNFLRQRVLPLLKPRWPQLDQRIQSTARACAEADELARLLAEQHFHQLNDGPDCLRLSGIRDLPMAARRNLLQWWLGGELGRTLGDGEIDNLLNSPEDARPEIVAGEFALRRFQGHIYRVPPAGEPLAPDQRLVARRVVRDGEFLVCLQPIAASERPAPALHLAHRQGGERLRLRAGAPARPLKKWLQERQVPPWERNRLPLVFCGDELVAVADLWCSAELAGQQPRSGWQLDIRRG